MLPGFIKSRKSEGNDDMSALYIYGVVKTNLDKILSNLSTTEGEQIYTVEHQEISAVVSRSKITDYSFLPKDTLARRLLNHQLIIEKIMNLGGTIVPMKLGTLLSNEKEVIDFLDNGYTLSQEILKKIDDKIEIDVAVTWKNLNLLLKEIGEYGTVKEFKEGLLKNSAELSNENKIKIGILIKNQLEQIRELTSVDILDSIRGFYEDIKAHPLMDDTMIANFALLIRKNKLRDLERKIDELNLFFSERLNFRVIGPLPPYSFYTIEIKKLQLKDLDWAVKKLGLNHSYISKEQIRNAYRRLSFSLHPDKNPDAASEGKEFMELNKAYKILNDYYLSSRQNDYDANKFYAYKERNNSEMIVMLKE